MIQTTFSLIDQSLIHFFSANLLTRIYSICFQCFKVNSIVQNISISALFALTECLFSYGGVPESFELLGYFLEYLFNNKRYTWMKDAELKGLVWDMSLVAVKNLQPNHLHRIQH